LPGLNSVPKSQLTKHVIVEESIAQLGSQQAARVGAINSHQALIAERDELLHELNSWRTRCGMDPQQARIVNDDVLAYLQTGVVAFPLLSPAEDDSSQEAGQVMAGDSDHASVCDNEEPAAPIITEEQARTIRHEDRLALGDDVAATPFHQTCTASLLDPALVNPPLEDLALYPEVFLQPPIDQGQPGLPDFWTTDHGSSLPLAARPLGDPSIYDLDFIMPGEDSNSLSLGTPVREISAPDTRRRISNYTAAPLSDMNSFWYL